MSSAYNSIGLRLPNCLISNWLLSKRNAGDESRMKPRVNDRFHLGVIFHKWHIPIIVILCIASRLPQLYSPNLWLDSDECVSGLMAKHLSEGKEIPIFFYGQNYGFSLIEALFGALGYKLLGVSALSLKLSMLALWIIGVLFYYLAASNIIGDNRKGFWLTLLLIFIPAWAIWSMKARGGYTTAFVVSSIIIFLISQSRINCVKWFVIGIATSIVFLSQRIWIVGLLPILLFRAIKKCKISHIISFISGVTLMALIVNLLVKFIKGGSNLIFFTTPVIFNFSLINNALKLLKSIYVNLTGFYYLDYFFNSDFVTSAIAVIWIILIIIGVVIQITQIKKRKYDTWAHILFLSTTFTIISTWVLDSPFFGYRYLLPLSGLMILWIGVEISDYVSKNIQFKKACYLLSFTLIILGVYSLISFRDFTFLPKIKISGENISEEKRISLLIKYLKDNDIKYTFSLEPLLTWYAMFYSKEEILSRHTEPYDRYPEYPQAVDKAFEERKKTAIIGYSYAIPKYLLKNLGNIIVIGNRYFIYPNPDRRLLTSVGLIGNRDPDRKVCNPLKYRDPKYILVE